MAPDVLPSSPQHVRDAACALLGGQLIGLPTETVYGLAGDACRASAVRAIFALKGRPMHHPLIVHVVDQTQLPICAREVTDTAWMLVNAFWPGPLTVVVKKSARILPEVTAGQETVAVRMPSHPLAQAVLRECARQGSGLLVAPSANAFGHVSPTSAAHVLEDFPCAFPQLAFILDGGVCEWGMESTIIDCSSDPLTVLRPGCITVQHIEAVCRKKVYCAHQESPRVSGGLAHHYAPGIPMYLMPSGQVGVYVRHWLQRHQRIFVLSFQQPPTWFPSQQSCWTTVPCDASAYARQLFHYLRAAESADYAVILVESVPKEDNWQASADRLTRASCAVIESSLLPANRYSSLN